MAALLHSLSSFHGMETISVLCVRVHIHVMQMCTYTGIVYVYLHDYVYLEAREMSGPLSTLLP